MRTGLSGMMERADNAAFQSHKQKSPGQTLPFDYDRPCCFMMGTGFLV